MNDLPPDVQGALSVLRLEFAQCHCGVGHVTRNLCCEFIQKTWSDDSEACWKAYDKWCSRYPALQAQALEAIASDAPSAQFRAFFDFYIELMADRARDIFQHLMEIALRNEGSLTYEEIEWALSLTRHFIRSYQHLVTMWVHEVCDPNVVDPWQAPLFLTMNPAGDKLYAPRRVWERMNAESSTKVLEAFGDEYVRRLEDYIEKDAGAAFLEKVRHP